MIILKSVSAITDDLFFANLSIKRRIAQSQQFFDAIDVPGTRGPIQRCVANGIQSGRRDTLLQAFLQVRDIPASRCLVQGHFNFFHLLLNCKKNFFVHLYFFRVIPRENLSLSNCSNFNSLRIITSNICEVYSRLLIISRTQCLTIPSRGREKQFFFNPS